MSALSNQVGGSHYKDCPIQPIEYIHANKLGFIEGSIVKYITRWRSKGGIQDLEKIRHFVDLLIELEKKASPQQDLPGMSDKQMSTRPFNNVDFRELSLDVYPPAQFDGFVVAESEFNAGFRNLSGLHSLLKDGFTRDNNFIILYKDAQNCYEMLVTEFPDSSVAILNWGHNGYTALSFKRRKCQSV